MASDKLDSDGSIPLRRRAYPIFAIREAAASRALDGDTQHVAAADGSCCWRHAMAKIAELEAEKRVIVAELTALRSQVAWIPTDVRMPTVNERVLGVYQERDEGWQQWAIFTWHPKSGWWDEALDEPLGDDCEMVYWRPVPRLPEAKVLADADE